MTILEPNKQRFKYVSVGLTSGSIKSHRGQRRYGDYTLSQVNGIVPNLIILPDGQSALRQLFVVPHVHTLIKSTIDGGGHIALSSDAEFFVRRSKIARLDNQMATKIISQRRQSLEEFAQAIHKI